MDLTTLDPQPTATRARSPVGRVPRRSIGVDPTDLTKLLPRLAESWEANADNTVFTFTLTRTPRSPVRRARATAADVKFCGRAWPDSGIGLVPAQRREDDRAPDDHTVVVTFEAPNSAFMNIISALYMGILSRPGRGERRHGGHEDAAEQWFLANSAGSGPFVLESYSEGDELVLARNDDVLGHPVAVPGVTFKQVKDATAQLQQLQQGDVTSPCRSASTPSASSTAPRA